MMEMTVVYLMSLIGQTVPTIPNSLVMEHVTIISITKLSAIMMVLTVVSKDISYKVFPFAILRLESNCLGRYRIECFHS